MKKLVVGIALLCAFFPISYAQDDSGTKSQSKKAETTQSPSTIGDGVREVSREIKSAGRKVRRAVVTECADGRHTVKGHAACAGHGGVSPQN